MPYISVCIKNRIFRGHKSSNYTTVKICVKKHDCRWQKSKEPELVEEAVKCRQQGAPLTQQLKPYFDHDEDKLQFTNLDQKNY